MPTAKNWTATDLEQGKLIIIRYGTEIHLERRYQFLDASGQVLDQIAGGRFVEDVPITGIPQNILAALQAIDDWTYQKALEKEGML